MTGLLLDSHPILVIPELAQAVGLNEAIILQQIHYWALHNQKANRNQRDGFWWAYNSYEEWQKQFPWWSLRTIKRTFAVLETKALVVSANYNKMKMDRTKWYRINYEELNKISPLGQNGTMESDNMAPPLPETKQRLLKSIKVSKAQTPTGDSRRTLSANEEKNNSEHGDTYISPSAPSVESVYSRAIREHGADDAEWGLRMIGYYVDDYYPRVTGKHHPQLNQHQRMGFARKFLDFVNEMDISDNEPDQLLLDIVNDPKIPDPTIFIATDPKVLGAHALKLNHVPFECLADTRYCPVEGHYLGM
ncbi:hypothetical protein LJC63_12360 [Ruminococcaceae bacterium OttesenSCG-928-L11]|nr:hypothetical protein [Ruminococcaceae bacterium OttesenSCG-928-L11]